ncbi:uncharacterized protein LOC110465056 isoform X1 [Mizuhopecten yessoensis]|uniref:uncharacterized protein LOC110465056 isoform X1 n=1 Tax=Mizuhopecten yessoensis TaxID=6573 RepID=UPI000B45D121|nr:uncharacterized protein LOC110465056 isoform X1 [Mizuhopecten yessoensis]
MGNDYSCDVHSKHNSYAERDACVRKRTTNSEIEALKLKHNLRFTCNSGHAHRDRKEVLDCHDFELRKHFISTCGRELTSHYISQGGQPALPFFPSQSKPYPALTLKPFDDENDGNVILDGSQSKPKNASYPY